MSQSFDAGAYLKSDPSGRAIKFATFIPLVALVTLAGILGFLIMQLLQASSWVEHADLVETNIYKVQKFMIDSETGLRGFSLNHDRHYLDPYLKAQPELAVTFEKLKTLVVDPGQTQLLLDIQTKFSNWVEYWNRGTNAEIDSRNLSLSKGPEGKRRMDEIRASVDRFLEREEEIKAVRRERMNFIFFLFLGLGAGLGLFIMAFWIFFARRTYQQMFSFYGHVIQEAKKQGDRLGDERFRFYAEAMPQMAFIANTKGDIIYYNKRWYDFVGIQGTEGWGWKPILHADDFERTTKAWLHSLATGEAYSIEYRLRRFDGEYRWHLGRAIAVHGDDGVITEWLGTNTDIHDQKQASVKLIELKDQAENANRLKSLFLSNISHEMRTPLGVIIGTTDLVQENSADASEVAKLSAITQRNARHLFGLVNDILDLAKIEAGSLLIESRMFPLQSFIDELVASLEIKAKEKALTLTIRSEGPIPATIESDPFRITQLLNNLIGNAIKFTDAGSVDVVIRTIFPEDRKTRAQVEFIIKDTGIGLTHGQKANLFVPFVQADGSITRKYGGTGLGLVLSREYAEALGGGVEILESALGEGSTFRAWITDGYLSQERFTEIVEQTVEENQPVKIEPSHASPLDGRRILLVDDSPDNRLVIARYLKAAGAFVETADNGLQGVEKALEGDFDVVLMDLSMPVLDGEQATIRLREQNYKRPILALTAHAMKGESDRALKIGFSDYITKPVDRSFLIRRLSEFPKVHRH